MPSALPYADWFYCRDITRHDLTNDTRSNHISSQNVHVALNKHALNTMGLLKSQPSNVAYKSKGQLAYKANQSNLYALDENRGGHITSLRKNLISE